MLSFSVHKIKMKTVGNYSDDNISFFSVNMEQVLACFTVKCFFSRSGQNVFFYLLDRLKSSCERELVWLAARNPMSGTILKYPSLKHAMTCQFMQQTSKTILTIYGYKQAIQTLCKTFWERLICFIAFVSDVMCF